MVVYDINDNKIIEAPLTESAEHEEELGKSNLVRLSWQSDIKVTLPVGAYIVPFDDGIKYRLLDPYTPNEDATAFKYTPEFQHPLMWLSRVPFLYETTDSEKNTIKQQEWSYDGLTTNALEYVCKAINEALGITENKFTYTLCGNVDASVSFSVSANDILSVLSSIAQACKNNPCEWHLSWKHRTLYFGQISINIGENVPILKAHDNIQFPSVNESKENYYNCFYPQGSIKNMSRKALVGTGNYATLARLGLDKTIYPDGYIYIDTDGKITTKAKFEASKAVKQTLALSFDDVYPHIDLYVYNVRQVVKKLKNSQTNKVELDSDGKEKTYTIWYISLAYPTTIKDNTKTLVNTTNDKDEQGNVVTHYWYSYELDVKKQVLQGHTLKGFFKVNTHATDGKYDALTQSLVGQPNGQDGFELRYHKDVSASSGEYEIVKYQNGDIIIPTNESEGLYPRGKEKPDFTCNMVVLFNIVMGENETKAAQEELAARTIKEIKRRTQDNNNYSFSSNAVEFAKSNPNLYIGQTVIFNDDNGHELNTRILKLITKIDYPIIQEIVVGNQAVKGTISQLKEDVNNILSGNFSGGGGLNAAQATELIRNYTDTRFLRKDTSDTAQELITFLKGIALNGGAGIDGEGRASLNSVQIGDFVSKLSGGVFRQDTDGTTYLETDRLYVRMKAYFESLEIVKTQYSYGNRIVGKGGIVISKVEMIDNRGNITENKLECSVYRCYFVNKQEGLEIYNPFVINDQAFTKEDNLKKGTTKHTTNHYLWRAVAGVGDDYVDLSENICLVGSDAPLVGDNLCQFGYRGADKPDRTCAIMESITGENVPSYIMLQDITDFSLNGKEVLMFGFNNGIGKAFFKVYGDSYTGNKERTEYFEYKDGKATFSGEAHFKAGSTGGENIQGITTSSANLIINSGFVGNYETRQLEDNTPLKKGTEMYSPSLFGWNGTAKVVSNQASMSGCSVILSDESISQPIKMGLSIAASYAFSCKAKGSNLTVRIGGYEKIISLTSDFQTIKVLAVPTGGNILELIGDCELYEPMLVVGNVFSTWQPSPLDNNKATSIKQAISYLQEALENDTTINGGLLLSTLIKVGRNVQGKWKEAAGMSGISNDDNDVAFYAGGTFEQAIRTVMSYIGNPQYKPSEQELSEMAQFVVTHGGQAIFNNAILRGLIYADGGILRNIRTPNDSLKINENGDIEIVGKFESAVNGKRIVIDPENGNVMLKEEHLLSDGSKMELPSIRIDVNDIHIANQDIANIPNLSCFRYDKNGVIEKIVSLSTADVKIESKTPKNNYYATFGETGAWFMSYNKLTQKAEQMEVGISDLSDEDGKPTGAGLFFRATRYPTYEESPIGGVYLDGETLKVKLK